MVIVIVFVYCIVDDVSAQTSCTIFPTNPTTLAIRNPLGALVEFNCQCMDGNGMILNGTRWFHNGNLVTNVTPMDGPYTNADGTLNIITFTDSDAGTYTCSPTSTSSAVPPGDMITLSAGMGEYNYCYSLSNVQYIPSHCAVYALVC